MGQFNWSVPQLEKYYWTLPFGARTEEANVAPSPFFPGRHTYQFSTPNINGELHWLIVKGTSGLLYPRLTTKETILQEQGVFQEGMTTVLLKPPGRTFAIDVLVRGSNRLKYRQHRQHLGYILSFDHNTAAPPPGFEEVNEFFDIQSKWGRPNPFTFTESLPDEDGNYRPFHVDCYVQTVEPQLENESPDGFSLETTIRLKADSADVYTSETEATFAGTYDDDTVAEPEVSPTSFLDSITNLPINYSSGIFASGRAGFRIEMPVELPTGGVLYSFGIYETVSGNFARFKHADYPTGGWVLPATTGPFDLILEFNSNELNRSFIARYNSIGDIALENAKSPRSSWDDFEFVPGMVYRFFLELDDNSGTPTNITSNLFYTPRWVGI